MDTKTLIRDFVFQKAVVLWCLQAGDCVRGHVRFVPPTFKVTGGQESHPFAYSHVALGLREGDRVWLCEGRRINGSVVNHRRKPDSEEDAKEKELEAHEMKLVVTAHQAALAKYRAERAAQFDDDMGQASDSDIEDHLFRYI